MKPDKHAHRTLMKQRRRELAPTQIRDASAQVSRQLWRLPAMQRARRIAIYMSVAGEIDCDQIVKTAWLRKIETFAPILMGKRLIFAPLKKHTRTTPNRYHIPEPTHSRRQCIKSSQLDVVIVPVLAFDKDNNRLGMGGGFYDRSFAYMKHRQKLQRPLLIGVAYDFQRVPKLQAEPWDVQLHAVITDKESYGSH